MKDFKYGAQVHPGLIETSKALGFRDGGAVKMRTEKQDSMDHGVQPARRGKNARDAQEDEAGGTGPLKPGYKKGGKAKKENGGKVEVEVEITKNGEEEEEENGKEKKKSGGAIRKGHMARSTKHKSSYENKPHSHMKKGGDAVSKGRALSKGKK